MTVANRGYEAGYFRMPAYKRVDIGLSYELLNPNDAVRDRSILRYFKSAWLGFDIFNLFDMKNVNSYYWISRPDGEQFPIPNYLTGRQFNVRLIVDF